MSHAAFLNAYLESRGAEPVNCSQFETLPGSTATGATPGKLRLTNLMHLNVDTSWFVRYRSTTNPDLGATFPQAVTLNRVTAIPRTNADFNGSTNSNFPGTTIFKPSPMSQPFTLDTSSEVTPVSTQQWVRK